MRLNFDLKYCVFLFYVLATISSCNIYKQIPEGQSVLVRNDIKILDQEKDLINDFFFKDELYQLPVQKPNKKILGIPVSQHIWALYNKKKVTKFTQFMKTKIGSQPVLFDTSILPQSKTRFENYYFNLGYFENQVDVEIHRKKKKTTIVYNVQTKEPYKIRKIYIDSTSPLQRIVARSMPKSNIHTGDIFNIVQFESEINRITELANNHGYYSFNKEYVKYKLDTFRKEHLLDVYIQVLEESDTTQFQIYKVDSIRVLMSGYTEGNSISSNSQITDFGNIRFAQNRPTLYDEKFIRRFIYQRPDSIYSKEYIDQTIQRLTDLSNFKIINSNIVQKDGDKRNLQLYYTLSPLNRHSTSLGLSAYNSTLGLIGTSIRADYANKNLTQKADRFELSLAASVDLNLYLNQTQNNFNGLFARQDISLGAKYNIEKFIFPFFNFDNKSYIYSRTVFNLQYTYSRRLGFYDIHNIGSTAGYEWTKRKANQFVFNPLLFNFVYIPEGSVTQEFTNTLNANPFLKTSFSSAFILGANFSFSHRHTYGEKEKSNIILRTILETAGNSAYLIHKLTGDANSKSQINNVDISQYASLQAEAVSNNTLNKVSSIHGRLKFGIGLPYGNSNRLPYIKQFFIGGQYSLRAFQARTIGPGSLNPGLFDTDSTRAVRDQLGNMVLEANLEYRFNIISFLKGALFVDVGNIWNSSKEFTAYDEAVFKLDEFYKQLYIGTGAGLRFDFNYFVFRLDLGIPVRVPYNTANQWLIADAKPFNWNWVSKNIVLNFAVGFPF